MKKIILGLFLTVGSTGSIFAEVLPQKENSVDNIASANSNDYILNDTEIKLEDDRLLDCYYSTKLRFEFDGEVIYTTIFAGSSPCVNGDEDGTVGITIIRAW